MLPAKINLNGSQSEKSQTAKRSQSKKRDTHNLNQYSKLPIWRNIKRAHFELISNGCGPRTHMYFLSLSLYIYVDIPCFYIGLPVLLRPPRVSRIVGNSFKTRFAHAQICPTGLVVRTELPPQFEARSVLTGPSPLPPAPLCNRWVL